MKPGMPLVTRLMSKAIVQRGCWGWTGCTNTYGYGRIKVRDKNLKAHRVSYELFSGPIPDGLTIDHLCRTRSCVRPDHLEAVTGRENILRGIGLTALNAKKTTCPRGHPFDRVRKNGTRACRACNAEQGRSYRLRKRLAGYVNTRVAGSRARRWFIA